MFFASNGRVKPSNKATEKISLNSTLENIGTKLSNLSKNGRPVRLAIVPFYSAFKNSNSENKFGEYFAERAITTIKSVEHQIKLFERKRLDAITKEHALNLTGLINQNDAVKIGELVPIDYLLTGTYSKLESSIEVNGRVLDVVTGEIVETFIHRIAMTNELASLFPIKQESTVTSNATNLPTDNKPACYSDFIKIKDLYNSESQRDIRIKEMTTIALTIPVNLECGEYHQFYIEYLRQQKIFPKAYTNYLYNEVLNFNENPDVGALISYVLRYFHSDSVVSNKEWELGISIIRKTNDIAASAFTKYLFMNPTKSNIELQKRRVDQLIKLIKEGKVATGHPTSFDKGFYHLFSVLSTKKRLSELQIFLFNKYSSMIKNEKYGEKLYTKTVKIFSQEKNFQNKQLLIDWMNRLSIFEPTNTSNAYSLNHLLEELSNNSDKSSQDSILLALFITKMKPSMEKLFPLISKGYSGQKCIELCIKNDIIIKGFTPALADLKIKLASESTKDKREAASLIRAYGKNAKPIEKDVARLLRRSENLKFNGATNLDWDLLKILENTKPSDPEIIKSIFNKFSSRRHEVPKTAMEVMATLGKRSIDIMTSDFANLDPYIQIYVVKTLAKMGNHKKEATSFIKNVH